MGSLFLCGLPVCSYLASFRPVMVSALSVVGGLFLAYHGIKFGLQVIHALRIYVFPALGFKNDLRKFGTWAVVTGSTDGIGKSYAKQLARQGMNIALISRNLKKLQNVEKEIRSEYHVETRIIVLDFSGGPEIYQDIGDKLKDLEIGILVNNVGVAVDCPDYFLDFPVEDHYKMINVNILSVVMMTYIVLPMMVARTKGLVINLSSTAGFQTKPLITMYSSTKAFVDFFSRCLHREYSDKGIIVQSIMPGTVKTNMTSFAKLPSYVPNADEFVNQALGTVGVESRTCGYWTHSLKSWIFDTFLPSSVQDELSWRRWNYIREMVKKQKKESQNKTHKE